MKKILVVDDDEGILEAMQAMLEAAGYAVETSRDGNEVLEKLHEGSPPDAILLDVLLSGRDGREVCKQIKSQEDTRHVPIIMVSAHPTAKAGIEVWGADDFLAKPFDINDLEKAIERHVSKS